MAAASRTTATKKAGTKVATRAKTTATKSRSSKTSHELTAALQTILAKVAGESVVEFAKRNLSLYGSHVVEQRAVPDYRDGLKPVHRTLLWAAYQLMQREGQGFKKAARIVGDTIGQFHPHGDQVVYQALVGMVGTWKAEQARWGTRNINVPLIEGFGNYGGFADNAAAMRYTEARLSKFAQKYLLDSDYMQVIEYVANYSEDKVIPLVLPAKVPVLLLNGSFSIGFGISNSDFPAFEAEGVIAATVAALEAPKYLLDSKTLAKMLNPTYHYGGTYIGGKQALHEFLKTGKGKLEWQPTSNVEGRDFIISSVCPGLASETSVVNMLEKVGSFDGVQTVFDATDKRGVRFVVQPKRGISSDAHAALIEKIKKEITRSMSYQVGVTERYTFETETGSKGSRANFTRANVMRLLANWCQWRVDIEQLVLDHLIKNCMNRLRRYQLMLLAVDNLDIIMKALRLKNGETEKYMSKYMKITLEEAGEILEFKVRQLKALERTRIVGDIKKVEDEIKKLKLDKKNPEARIVRDLKAFKLADA